MKPACCHFFALLLVPAAFAGAPHQVGFDSLKQLVLDTRVIERVENARLVLGAPVKDPRNPLFTADRPWENATNNLYPNVLWDEQEQIFKIWYKNVLADKDVIAQMDRPSTVHDVGWYLLYATSRDGIAWEKPALGLHKFDGREATNIVARDTPNVGVFKDTHDPDAMRRYKMVYDVGLGKPRVRFSADGMHWGEPIEAKGFSSANGDTHNNAFWDSRIGKYVWFTKLYLGERLVARFESDDFITWKSSGMVLRSSVAEGRSSQTYCLPVFPYGNIYLGYVMMYNLGKGRTVDCELAWSHDGIRWQRVAPGTPMIPRGAPGSYDSQCIYAQAGPATAQDGQLLIYYGGSDVPHTGWKRHCLPSLARLRLDGFAGYEARDTALPANLTSSPVRIVNERLTLSADAAGGSVVVEVLGDQGRVLAKSIPVTGDLTAQPVKLDLAPYVGRTVRLRFVLTRARLYAFGGVSLVNAELPAPAIGPLPRYPVPSEPVRVSFDEDPAGWKGVDRLEHRRDAGFKGGFITVSRASKLNPFASSSPDARISGLAGDWPAMFGGATAAITVRVRTRQAGAVLFELFAQDTQWNYRQPQPAGGGWKTHTAVLRYDWTDAQAEAAGWTRAQSAFSWRDTIRHVGRLHIGFVPDPGEPAPAFDLDELEVRGK